MDKFALIVALAALGVAGWTIMDRPAAETGTPAPEAGVDSERLDRIEADMARILAKLEEQPHLGGAAPADVPVAGPSLEGNATAPGTNAPSIEERLARLEQNSAARQEKLEKMEKEMDEPFHVRPGRMFGPNRFLHSVDSAANALELDDRQKQDLERIVDSTKARLDELYNTPNEDGELLKDVGSLKIDFKPGETPDISKIMETVQKRQAFKQGKVPGTNETYAQAEARIKKDGKQDARSLLTEDQQKTWDKSHTDGMFGGGPGGGSIAVSTSFDSFSPSGPGEDDR